VIKEAATHFFIYEVSIKMRFRAAEKITHLMLRRLV